MLKDNTDVVYKKVSINKLIKTEADCPFEFSRHVDGTLEFTIMLRFIEFLIHDHFEGKNILIGQFNTAVRHSSSAVFEKIKGVSFTSIEKQGFMELMKQLDEILKLTAKSEPQDPKMGTPGSYHVKKLIELFNKDQAACRILQKIVEAKNCKMISEFLGITIVTLSPDLKTISEFKGTSGIFKSDEIIYVNHIDNNACCLYYNPKRIDKLLPSSKSVVIPPGRTCIFPLQCGHIWNIKFNNPMSIREANPNANLVLKCPEKLCFYVPNDELAKKILVDNYDDFYKPKKVNETACIFDGMINPSNIMIDKKHYMCVKCMNLFLSYKKNNPNPKNRFQYFNDKKVPNMLNCPYPGCTEKFGFKQFFRALDKSELQDIQKMLKGNSSIVNPNKEIYCLLDQKISGAESKDKIEHKQCKGSYHKSCLKKMIA